MNISLIIILAIILFILIALNNIQKISNSEIQQAGCSQTTFGCCQDGVNSKINYYGTNCPSNKTTIKYFPSSYDHHSHHPYPYQHIPIPIPVPLPPPNPLKPVGGCSGTKYGCCPNNYTPKFDQIGTNCLID